MNGNVAPRPGGGGGVGGGMGAEASFASGGVALESTGLKTALAGPSVPQTSGGLPKSTSASWDPHVQSSGSAFSVPAGRGGGGAGGRGEGSVGVGGGAGSAGFGALNLGGFRALGGDHRDFQVREHMWWLCIGLYRVTVWVSVYSIVVVGGGRMSVAFVIPSGLFVLPRF